MTVYSKMKELGSGKVGKRAVKAASGDAAIRISFISDARLFYKVFGREKARELLKDTIYTTDQNSLQTN